MSTSVKLYTKVIEPFHCEESEGEEKVLIIYF